MSASEKDTQTSIIPPLPTPVEFQGSHHLETSKASLTLLQVVHFISTKR